MANHANESEENIEAGEDLGEADIARRRTQLQTGGTWFPVPAHLQPGQLVQKVSVNIWNKLLLSKSSLGNRGGFSSSDARGTLKALAVQTAGKSWAYIRHVRLSTNLGQTVTTLGLQIFCHGFILFTKAFNFDFRKQNKLNKNSQPF